MNTYLAIAAISLFIFSLCVDSKDREGHHVILFLALVLAVIYTTYNFIL